MTKVEKDHYSRLAGRRITRIVESDDDEHIPGFELDDGKTVWILRDPEGNGPGFLEIEGG